MKSYGVDVANAYGKDDDDADWSEVSSSHDDHSTSSGDNFKIIDGTASDETQTWLPLRSMSLAS